MHKFNRSGNEAGRHGRREWPKRGRVGTRSRVRCWRLPRALRMYDALYHGCAAELAATTLQSSSGLGLLSATGSPAVAKDEVGIAGIVLPSTRIVAGSISTDSGHSVTTPAHY
jgi:hypothetical protein